MQALTGSLHACPPQAATPPPPPHPLPAAHIRLPAAADAAVTGNAYTQIDSLLIKKPSKMAKMASTALRCTASQLQAQRLCVPQNQVQVRPMSLAICWPEGKGRGEEERERQSGGTCRQFNFAFIHTLIEFSVWFCIVRAFSLSSLLSLCVCAPVCVRVCVLLLINRKQ